MKKRKLQSNFPQNIYNKYSIRKYSIGTASILVSSLLFLGFSSDASASTEELKAEIVKTTTDEIQPKDSTQSKEAPSTDIPKDPTLSAQKGVNKPVAPVQQDTNKPTDNTAPQEQNTKPAQPKAQPDVDKDKVPVENTESKTKDNIKAPTNYENNKAIIENAKSASSSLDASDNIVGPDPTVQTGVTKAADLPVATKEQVKNINNQITWIDFSDQNAISNVGQSDTGQIALKVGTKYEKEIMPGLVVKATVKSLQPFEATPMYKRRAEGDPNSGYNPNATNIVRKDAHDDEIDKEAFVVVTKQDPNWSHLKKAGIDTGEELTNFGSNRNYGNVGATFEVKTIYNGKEVPANIVMADGEEAKNIESLIYTTNGSGWELFANARKDGNPENYMPQTTKQGYFTDSIDKGGHGKGKYYATPDENFGGLGTQIFGSNQTRQDYNSVPIVLTTGATEVSFFVNSPGIQTVQMGFVLIDKGDAPETYGEAIHAITENSNISQPFLGSQKADVDFDTLDDQHKNWETDDINTPNSVKDPDEGEKQLVGVTDKYVVYNAADQSYSLDVIANTADNDTSYVRGWVDFNNNGVFDEKEGSDLVTVSRTGADGKKITLTFKNIPQLTDDALDYLRVRVRTSLAKDSVNRPNGVAYSGEIEDFEIRVVHPPRGEKSETTGVQGQPQTSKAVFTAHGRVDKDWPKVNEIDTTKDIKIVDDQGNLVSTLTVPGEGKYDIAPDGSITFTPEPQFTGTAKGIVLRATDLNGNTSGWTSNTAENNLENNNNGVNGTTTMDAVYIPIVTAVTPTADPVETTDIQGKPQTGTPVFKAGDPAVPIDESVPPKLVDPATGAKVDTLTVPGEGTYTANPDGTVTFNPEPQFKGEGKGVDVKRVDKNGTPVTAKYTPKVNEVIPTAKPAETTGVQGQPQTGTPEFKGGDPLVPIDETAAPKLVDPQTGNKVPTLTIPNEGTYTANEDGTITFTPDSQFTGKATPVTVERVDTNGTPVQTTYTPSVTAVTPTGTPTESEGPQGIEQTGTPEFKGGDPLVPIDENVAPKLVDPTTGNEVDKVEVPGEGTYTVDPDGKVTFTPDPKFTGEGKGVDVKRVDKNGTPVTAKYTPKVNTVTPTGTPTESEGPQGVEQNGTPEFKGGDPLVPIDENVAPKLVDPETGNKVSTLTIPNEGTYTANEDGTVTFTPDPKFTGKATPVTVERVDKNGTPAQTTYTPNVTAVTPTGTPATSTGLQGHPQEGTPVFKGGDPLVPINENVAPKLIDPETGNEVDNVTVPGEGTYTVDPDGKVTFTPDPQFKGEGKGVEVKRVDKNGTPVTAKFVPTVTAVTPKGTPATSTGVQGQPQTGTPTFEGGDPFVPIDETVAPKLIAPNTGKEVDKVVIPGEGTYTIDPSGKVTFTPDPNFTGEGKGVVVKRVDKNGTVVTAKYTPTVKATPKTKPTPTKPVVPEGKTPVKKDKVITSNEDEVNTVAPEKQAKKAQPATDKAETKHQKAASANKAKALPKTGNEDNNANTTLLGSILVLFGLAAFSRRKKEDK